MIGVPLLDLMKDNAGHDRKFKRYWVNFPVSIRPVAGEDAEGAVPLSPAPEDPAERLPALTHNISLSGIAFVCAGRYEPGRLVEIEIALEARTHFLLARVRRRRQLDLPGEALYYYGTQLVRTDAVLQFIPIAAEFLLAQGSERTAKRSNGMAPKPVPMEQQVTRV